MDNLSANQEAVFKVFDELIDKDIDVRSYIQINGSLRIRIGRNFKGKGSSSAVSEALRLYGFTGFEESTTPTQYDLYKCFECDYKTYEIKFDEEFVAHLSVVHNLEIRKVKSLARDRWIKEIKIELLEKFVTENEEDFLANPYTYKNNSRIRGYFRNVYGDIETFRSAFNINKSLNPNRTMQGHYYYIEAGRRFERLIKRCFDAIQTEVDVQMSIGNCRPDFVLTEGWLDAKLSKSTAFYRSDTISKYTKHTDNLTILYAIDDVKDDTLPLLPIGVDFIHVLDYFEGLPQELQDEIKMFISEVKAVRRGEKDEVKAG